MHDVPVPIGISIIVCDEAIWNNIVKSEVIVGDMIENGNEIRKVVYLNISRSQVKIMNKPFSRIVSRAQTLGMYRTMNQAKLPLLRTQRRVKLQSICIAQSQTNRPPNI